MASMSTTAPSWEGVYRQLRDLGYTVNKVTWEDTGRNPFSSVGPNITDQTLVVGANLMAVVRRSNFADVTCDVPLEKFVVRTGNETGAALTAVPLSDVLKEKGWLLPRDTHVLVSTQLCLLPLGAADFTEFAVRLYNYQSTQTESALAVIVAASQGTSIAPILKPRERQVVYFNDKGIARPFEARRLKADRIERKVVDTGLQLSKDEKDRNQILVFHIPLRVKAPKTRGFGGDKYECFSASSGSQYLCELSEKSCALESNSNPFSLSLSRGNQKKSVESGPKFDAAMLRVSGRDAGKFFGLDPTKTYERDPMLPIRCVIQTYTAIGPADETLSPEAVQYVIEQLENPYRKSDAQGSLVTGTGSTDRVTAMSVGVPPSAAPLSLPSMMEM